jgi:hypothetical protein
MGIRHVSLGRSVSSYSELTAKNISVNGLNLEYNSWYYLAISAGTVNYRFRDFVVNGANKKPQYMYLLRAGIGSLERNYFILSYYGGRKQLFATGNTRPSFIQVQGLAAEAKWQLNRSSYITAEIAQSVAPDTRNNPPQTNTKWRWADKTSQAVALHVSSYIPATGSHIEAFYKHTGANFQSFSSFQTNTALESWHVKAEQNLFNQKLRLSAAIRKNEFSNPFLVQNYKSNTIFKSVAAAFRMRKWPVLSVGYQPLSQLTVLDSQVIENRFQTLNATLYHAYKIKDLRTATTIMYNKFYNTGADTGFIYYNATSLYLAQHFLFNGFSAAVAINRTVNGDYTLHVLDGNIQPVIPRFGTVGLGIKVNNLNAGHSKAGGYIHATIPFKQDVLSISYEHGYLPGWGKQLVRNEMANVQFVKTFNYR